MSKARSLLLLLPLALAPACTGSIDGEAGGADGGAGVEEAPDGAVPDAEPRVGRVTGTGGIGLRVRAAPSTDAEILGVLPEGAVIDILAGPDDGWYRVRRADLEGYSSADFVTEVPDGVIEGGYLDLLPWTGGDKYRVTQAHGGFSHDGDSKWAWDFGLPEGTPVRAAHNGVVRTMRDGGDVGCCSESCGYGANYVVLDRGDGRESLYLHLQSVAVTKGQEVVRGDLVGHSGATGYVCGAHLHFQMQQSPSGGGSADRPYNQSVQDFFHDSGEPLDPPAGVTLTSKNGLVDIP
ncbi:MAG TPA: peptidoglycan DD-metalloendopeptidase family protein [Kofleriaceae bacterium]|nr:peptidoglycan DD-metalloendopeptidase family protein [Kofleriaceae bacterium]